MKKLFLIRHAHSEKFSESGRDIDRKLTSEGMKVASLLGKYLQDEAISPDAMICSNAERAQMTTELIATQLNFEISEIQVVNSLYDSSVRQFVDYLCNLNSRYNLVLIIGHNPTLTYTADFLCDNVVNGMSPGSVVDINFHISSWEEISKGSGEFMNYYDVLSDG